VHSSLLANICLLNRAHHPQRQLLRVRQSLDTRDIEPLVGTVAPQGRYILAACEVPNPDRPIIPAAGEEATVRTGAQRLYRSFVPVS